MITGETGTFVMAWHQTEVDGLFGVPVDALAVGSVWRWTGRAARVDDRGEALMLTGAAQMVDLHCHAAQRLSRVLGLPVQSFVSGSEQPAAANDAQLFKAGFELTDGRRLFEATLVEVEGSALPLVVFTGALPPREAELWVTRCDTAPLARGGERSAGAVVCFVPGTLLDTPQGPRPVEQIAEDDEICTKDNGVQKVRWIGRRRITGSRMIAIPQLRPVRLAAGFLGQEGPRHDLVVSPDHRVVVKGRVAEALFNTPEVLVAARDLVNDTSVRIDRRAGETTYIHLMLDAHQIVWANGLECESFHPANAALDHLDEPQLEALVERFPHLAGNPDRYGNFARRCLGQGEAALLAHGLARHH